MWTTEDVAVAAAYDVKRWSELFSELMDTIQARFARPEPRRRVRDFVTGLLAPLPVKNCWTIAEHAGDDGPGGMRDLLGRAVGTTPSYAATSAISSRPGSGTRTGFC